MSALDSPALLAALGQDALHELREMLSELVVEAVDARYIGPSDEQLDDIVQQVRAQVTPVALKSQKVTLTPTKFSMMPIAKKNARCPIRNCPTKSEIESLKDELHEYALQVHNLMADIYKVREELDVFVSLELNRVKEIFAQMTYALDQKIYDMDEAIQLNRKYVKTHNEWIKCRENRDHQRDMAIFNAVLNEIDENEKENPSCRFDLNILTESQP